MSRVVPPEALRAVGLPEDLEVPITAEHQQLEDASRARAAGTPGVIIITAQGHAVAEVLHAKYPPLRAALQAMIRSVR